MGSNRGHYAVGGQQEGPAGGSSIPQDPNISSFHLSPQKQLHLGTRPGSPPQMVTVSPPFPPPGTCMGRTMRATQIMTTTSSCEGQMRGVTSPKPTVEKVTMQK